MFYEVVEGKGYVFEVVECMWCWVYEVFSIKGLVSYIDLENEKL